MMWMSYRFVSIGCCRVIVRSQLYEWLFTQVFSDFPAINIGSALIYRIRSLHILTTLTRYRLLEVIPYIRRISWVIPVRRVASTMSLGERLRRALSELGPMFVKFGQIVSTRRDLLSPDIADELAKLQDAVEPFAASKARNIIESELGKPLSDVYSDFNDEALASASIAQVHSARLYDNRQAVVIKVVRPDIRRQLRSDIRLLNVFAAVVERLHPEGQRLNPKGLVKTFETYVMDELDMLREAANASLLQRQNRTPELAQMPAMHWNQCTGNVLTMQRLQGIPIRDKAALQAAGVDLQQLAKQCITVFYQQAFANNLFHADLHPGNVLVDITNPQRPVLQLLDFGIVGSLPPVDLYYISENFLALFQRDYRRVAELHVDAGWVPADTDIEAMTGNVRTVGESGFSRPLNEVSFGLMFLQLLQVAQRYKLNMQPQLLMLQKTLLNVEGLARDLYPEMDLWAVVKPELEGIIRAQRGPGALIKNIRSRIPRLLEQTPEMPGLIHDALLAATRQSESMPDKPLQRHTSSGFWEGFFGVVLMPVGMLLMATLGDNDSWVRAGSLVISTVGLISFLLGLLRFRNK